MIPAPLRANIPYLIFSSKVMLTKAWNSWQIRLSKSQTGLRFVHANSNKVEPEGSVDYFEA